MKLDLELNECKMCRFHMGLLEDEILCNHSGKTETRAICKTPRGELVIPICPLERVSHINDRVKSILQALKENEEKLSPLVLKGLELTDEEFRLIVDSIKKLDTMIAFILENSRPVQG